MRTRKDILKDLVLLQGNLEILKKELSKFAWDSEIPLYLISVEEFLYVLEKSVNDEIGFETLTNWANMIECRDDLGFERQEMQEIIFDLANPEINGEITKKQLKKIIEELKNQ